MGLDTTFQNLLWSIPLALLVGLVYAFFFYYKEQSIDWSWKPLKYLLWILRTLAVASLVLLLIAPLIHSTTREVDEPIIIIAQDNSRSITLDNPNYYTQQYPKNLEGLIENLQKKFTVKTFNFGNQLTDSLKTSFTEPQTNIFNALQTLQERFAGRNIGAIILATDGIFNQGASPLNGIEQFKMPIYTIGLGNPIAKKDALIAHVTHNKIANFKNKFPIEVVVQANQCNGANSTLKILQKGQVLKTQVINIDANDFSKTITFELEAQPIGLQSYQIVLELISGEFTTVNNNYTAYIEVIDTKQRILILNQAPHPDVTAIKQAFDATELYQVQTSTLEDFKGDLDQYSLVICHQIPSITEASQTFLAELKRRKIGVWYILGEKSNLSAINAYDLGFNFTGQRSTLDVSQAVYNSGFGLFNTEAQELDALKNYPPLNTPFGTLSTKNTTNYLFYKKIGALTTTQPLWLFTEHQGQKIAVTAGEGLWRWRLTNYDKNQNHNTFDQLIYKTSQYLALQKQKSNFKIYHKPLFNEDETVVLDAELYNASLEPITTPEVSISIENSSQQTFNYTFTRLNKGYQLRMGHLKPDVYSYTAQTKYNNQTYTTSGQFTVQSTDLEALTTTANHQLLKSLAQQTKGKFVLPQELNTLESQILNNEAIKPSSYLMTLYKELIEWPWLGVLILVVLVLEWFLRKRYGGY